MAAPAPRGLFSCTRLSINSTPSFFCFCYIITIINMFAYPEVCTICIQIFEYPTICKVHVTFCLTIFIVLRRFGIWRSCWTSRSHLFTYTSHISAFSDIFMIFFRQETFGSIPKSNTLLLGLQNSKHIESLTSLARNFEPLNLVLAALQSPQLTIL